MDIEKINKRVSFSTGILQGVLSFGNLSDSHKSALKEVMLTLNFISDEVNKK